MTATKVLAAAALAGLMTTSALTPASAQKPPADAAQSQVNTVSAPVTQKSVATEGAPILLQADQATIDPENGQYIAHGNVEASFGGRTLYADKVVYDVEANEVHASGNVTITDERGGTLHASSVILDGTLENGIIETFGLLLGDNVRLAGSSAIRNQDDTEITQAVFSPCSVCRDERDGQPVWQIKALKVTHDRENRIIAYRHAYLEVLGVPVLYTPYFWHPDPSTERKSGFLVPNAGNSTDLGNFFEIPYFWAIAPNYDLTVAPLFISQESTVLKSEFRMRTKTGDFRFDGSLTNPDRRDSAGQRTYGKQLRDHLFGEGRFSPSTLWDWGFDVQLSSDDTYLKRYDILDVDELRNRAFMQTQEDRNFAIAESYYFIGLRSTDNQGQTPIILPSIDFEYHKKQTVFGGHLSFGGNFLSLQRTQGADMLRLSMEVNWDRPWISEGGHVINMFGHLRGDLYQTKNNFPAAAPESDEDFSGSARALPTVGVEWRYPLARPTSRGYQVIEPIAQIVVGPTGQNPAEIPNEDSLSFEFDDTNLFKPNKFPGLDRWEEGLRLNVGFKAALVGYGSGENSLTFGQTFRQNENNLFSNASGLGSTRSDYVGKLVLSPLSQMRILHRFRIDKDNFSFRRNEVDIRAGNQNYWIESGYLRLGAELSESGLEAREELSAKTHLKVRGNWSFEAQGVRNLEADEMIRASASLVYRDECTDFEITARRRFIEDRDIEPATSIFFRVRLKSLG